MVPGMLNNYCPRSRSMNITEGWLFRRVFTSRVLMLLFPVLLFPATMDIP